MPSHQHWFTAYNANFSHHGWATEGSTKDDYDGSFELPTSHTGGSASHNNMHPVYVLNYIIKQPKLGGESNPISLQAAPSTATIF